MRQGPALRNRIHVSQEVIDERIASLHPIMMKHIQYFGRQATDCGTFKSLRMLPRALHVESPNVDVDISELLGLPWRASHFLFRFDGIHDQFANVRVSTDRAPSPQSASVRVRDEVLFSALPNLPATLADLLDLAVAVHCADWLERKTANE